LLPSPKRPWTDGESQARVDRDEGLIIRRRALQYTDDESKAARVVTNELHIFDPKDLSKGIVEKLRLEGVTSCSISSGASPCVALFVAEKKVSPTHCRVCTSLADESWSMQGAPAAVKVHSLATLATMASSKKFYKADKIQMKWNKSGTNLLFLTQTEVDKTGKSYYGETNLYMMSAAGTFDCRVTLGESDVHLRSLGRVLTAQLLRQGGRYP
jgi:translation initiation factor 2A